MFVNRLLVLFSLLFIGQKTYCTPPPLNLLDISCFNVLTYNQKVNQLQLGKFTDPNHPIFKDEIQGEIDVQFQTLRLFHKEGRIPESSNHPYRYELDARALLLHGMSTHGSNAATFRGPIVNFVRTLPRERSKNKTKKEPVLNILLEDENYLRLAAEAIDLPFHGQGPQQNEFWDLGYSAEWLARYILQMKRQTPDLPLFIVTRSTSAILASLSLLNLQARAAINGLVLISPTWPGDEEILVHGYQDLMTQATAKRGLFINDVGMNWALTLMRHSSWVDFNFFDIPTLILIGNEDTQIHPREKLLLMNLASENRNVEYEEILDGKHDLLGIQNPNNKDRRASINTYRAIYKFMNKHLN
ncbi:MAG: hypothetical protein KDD40_09260 [Bdellovibrionales bacterium]|nr:hypothetical protein [Bdellovibrionales bacterium]